MLIDSEAWVSTQDELIDFVANIAGIEEKEWEDLSERRFSVQSAVLMTGLVIMADWIASNSDEDMFPLVRTEPWADEDEDFFFSESGEEDDIQSWSGLRIRADRAWSCVQLPHAWVRRKAFLHPAKTFLRHGSPFLKVRRFVLSKKKPSESHATQGSRDSW